MRIVKALVLSMPALTLSCLGAGVLVGLSGVSTPVYAAEKQQAISVKVGKPLKEALDLAQAKKFKEALAKVQEAQAVSGKTPYEEYKLNDVLAYVAVNLGDYGTAAKAYEATLESGQLAPEQVKERLDQLTKMYYQLKNYPKSIQYGNRYLKDVGPSTEVALLITQAYYIQEDYVHAIDAAQTLIRTANQAGQPVKEDYLKLLMSSQYKSDKEDDAVATLELLLAKYPSQKYWSDILGYVQSHGASSDRKNLEVYRLKLATGVLKDSEYVDLAQLSLALGFPGDAKSVLDKGFASKLLGAGANKDRETRLLNLAQTNAAADQKSLPAFEKEAAAAATGDAYVKLGEAYASYGNFDKAIEAIKSGLKKGNLKAADEAHLQLGVAYVGAKRASDAVAEFKAVPADSKLAHLARLWVIYAQNGKS